LADLRARPHRPPPRRSPVGGGRPGCHRSAAGVIGTQGAASPGHQSLGWPTRVPPQPPGGGPRHRGRRSAPSDPDATRIGIRVLRSGADNRRGRSWSPPQPALGVTVSPYRSGRRRGAAFFVLLRRGHRAHLNDRRPRRPHRPADAPRRASSTHQPPASPYPFTTAAGHPAVVIGGCSRDPRDVADRPSTPGIAGR
jgi:hypothetical protein